MLQRTPRSVEPLEGLVPLVAIEEQLRGLGSFRATSPTLWEVQGSTGINGVFHEILGMP